MHRLAQKNLWETLGHEAGPRMPSNALPPAEDRRQSASEPGANPDAKKNALPAGMP